MFDVNTFNFLFLLLSLIFKIECKLVPFNLKEITKVTNFYQITSIISVNFTEINTHSFFSGEIPSLKYSFGDYTQELYKNSSESAKIKYALQESLILFYTTEINKTESFIDFSIPYLSVRKRPKCLVIYISNISDYNNETVDVTMILKYAWKKKFLDFTVMILNLEEETINSTFLFYFYNPFNGLVYQKDFHNDIIEIFPDKLQNGFDYPIYIPELDPQNKAAQVEHIRRPNQKLRTNTIHSYIINFTMSILNLEVVAKNITGNTLHINSSFLKKWNLDIHSTQLYGGTYLKHFLIPTDESSENIYAFVPIIHTSQTDVFFKIYFNAVIIFVIVSALLCILHYFRVKIEHIKTFDFVRLLLSQSTVRQPQRLGYRIIFITIVIAAVKVTNDFLLRTVMIKFENKEMAFETYRELYDSSIQTYAFLTWLKVEKFLQQYVKDPNLLRILERTIIVDDSALKDCFNSLSKWKNVSCICYSTNPETYISNYQGLDGSAAIKVAQPPIFTYDLAFYWFSENSPYAMKFLEITRRVKETSLMRWPALTDNNRVIHNLKKFSKVTTNNGIKSEQLLPVLCFCYSVCVTVFVIELIVKKIRKKLNLYLRNNFCTCCL